MIEFQNIQARLDWIAVAQDSNDDRETVLCWIHSVGDFKTKDGWVSLRYYQLSMRR